MQCENLSRNKYIKTNQKFRLKVFQHQNQMVKEYKLLCSLHQNGFNRLSIKHNIIYIYICKDFWTTAPKTRLLTPSFINTSIYPWEPCHIVTNDGKGNMAILKIKDF